MARGCELLAEVVPLVEVEVLMELDAGGGDREFRVVDGERIHCQDRRFRLSCAFWYILRARVLRMALEGGRFSLSVMSTQRFETAARVMP